MIVFEGIVTINKTPHFLFSSETGRVSIPVDNATAYRVSSYLNKIVPGHDLDNRDDEDYDVSGESE